MGIAYNPNVSAEGLIFCYDGGNIKSNPGSGTAVYDIGGSGNNGTIINGVINTNNSFELDGTNEYIEMQSDISLDTSTGWSLSFWGSMIFDTVATSNGNTIFYSTTTPRSYDYFIRSVPIVLGIELDGTDEFYVSTNKISTTNRISNLFKMNINGNVNPSFDASESSYFSPRPWQLKKSIFSSNKLYVSYDQAYDPRGRSGLKKYNLDGSEDLTFNTLPNGDPGSGFDGMVHDFAEDSSGKLYVAGRFVNYNGTSANRIIKLNSNGTVDTSFNYGSGFDNLIYNLLLDSTNSKLYAFGAFTSYNGTAVNRIVRLNLDGTIDNTFNIGSGFNNAAYIGKFDSNGKLYVGGFFTSYNGTGANRIIRLNTDGSIDTGFNYGSGLSAGYCSHIEIVSNGQIFLCGSTFTSYNGTAANRIVRVNPDGSIDNTFSTGAGPNSQVRNLKELSNGDLIVGGVFYNYNLQAVNGLMKLDSSGTLLQDLLPASEFEFTGVVSHRFQSSVGISNFTLDPRHFDDSILFPPAQSELMQYFDGSTANAINFVETMSITGEYNLYVNGVLAANISNLNSGISIQDFCRGFNSFTYYNGKMHHATIHNRELTSEEVEQSYNALKSRFNP